MATTAASVPKKILFFDVETTQFAPLRPGASVYTDYCSPTNVAAWKDCRIMEIGCILYNGADGTWRKYESVVRPGRDFNVDPGKLPASERIHHITQEKAKKEGKLWVQIVPAIKQLIEEADLIVSHNLNFDRTVLSSELCRSNHTDIYRALQAKAGYCTMVESCAFNYGRRWLKLPDLYRTVCNRAAPAGLHRALIDTFVMMQCFFKMKRIVYGNVAIPLVESIREFTPSIADEGDTTQEMDDEEDEWEEEEEEWVEEERKNDEDEKESSSASSNNEDEEEADDSEEEEDGASDEESSSEDSDGEEEAPPARKRKTIIKKKTAPPKMKKRPPTTTTTTQKKSSQLAAKKRKASELQDVRAAHLEMRKKKAATAMQEKEARFVKKARVMKKEKKVAHVEKKRVKTTQIEKSQSTTKTVKKTVAHREKRKFSLKEADIHMTKLMAVMNRTTYKEEKSLQQRALKKSRPSKKAGEKEKRRMEKEKSKSKSKSKGKLAHRA